MIRQTGVQKQKFTPKRLIMVHRAGNRMIASSNPASARLWRRPCGVAWDAVPEPMVEYIDPGFFNFG
jgi:hypothetical protein